MINEQSIKDIYKIAGILEALSVMEGSRITAGMAAGLADAVDKLKLIGAELSNASVMLEISMPGRNLIDFFDEAQPETDVNSDEGTEEAARPETPGQ